MSRSPTGTAWPSNSWIAAASRAARGTPRVRIPTRTTPSRPRPPLPPGGRAPPPRRQGNAAGAHPHQDHAVRPAVALQYLVGDAADGAADVFAGEDGLGPGHDTPPGRR